MNNKNTKTKAFKTFTLRDIHNILNNKDTILKVLKNEKLLKFLNDVVVYLKLLYDIITARIGNVPVGIIITIVGVLLYLLSSIDLIPDYIPGIGLMDDVLLLSFCHHFTKSFIDRYKKIAKNIKKEP